MTRCEACGKKLGPRPVTQGRVLRLLRDSHLPVSTPDLTALLTDGRRGDGRRVWAALIKLRRKGLAASETLYRPDCRGRAVPVAFWRAA